ncbi:TIGR03619 family F420-dependent LLM class oxidoreductase [Catenulispora pinisilvae]|uniref:TIGR03619 family F420-dependent LLM class oxidoreductase n=1 Tax=Catenulispora pinisilvae TaxID=2705253 RepID=UPI0018922F5B|nr:TIGR03619 family F420-dependent LLM class oxidoreductase [Catenulispora pinisilvae]
MTLRIGVALPTNSRRFDGTELSDVARRMADRGCASLWVNDHLAAFSQHADSDSYPYTASGRPDWESTDPQYEALSVCAFLAATAATAGVTIGTSVLVLPQRHPIQLAKTTATLADLSAGRFVLGVGAGWARREMAVLGWDPATRGARLDEQIVLLRDLWRYGRPVRESVHYRIPPDLVLAPRPHPSQIPLILVGGMSDRAVRRVVELGDGWLAVAGPESSALAGATARLATVRAASGRPLVGHLKITADAAERIEPDRVLAATVAGGWDEISLEFVHWDTDSVARLVERLVTTAQGS